MATINVFCFSCQKVNAGLLAIGRKDECQFCKADLHVCKNCEMYDPKVYNECKEPQADVQRERERSNFCDYFKPKGQHAIDFCFNCRDRRAQDRRIKIAL